MKLLLKCLLSGSHHGVERDENKDQVAKVNKVLYIKKRNRKTRIEKKTESPRALQEISAKVYADPVHSCGFYDVLQI